MALTNQQYFAVALFDAARALRGALEYVHRDQALTWPQIRIIGRLHIHEGIGQSELGAMLEMEPMTISRQVDRLVQGDFVERRTEPGDRRVRRLFLTAKSRAMQQAIRDRSNLVIATALEGIEEAEHERLYDAFRMIADNITRPEAVARLDEGMTVIVGDEAAKRETG